MRRGRRVSSEGVQLVFIQGALPVSRFAVIVPTTVDKRTVVRNRLRRLVRESVRLALPDVKPGWDGVFLIRKGGNARELLRRAGLFV